MLEGHGVQMVGWSVLVLKAFVGKLQKREAKTGRGYIIDQQLPVLRGDRRVEISVARLSGSCLRSQLSSIVVASEAPGRVAIENQPTTQLLGQTVQTHAVPNSGTPLARSDPTLTFRPKQSSD